MKEKISLSRICYIYGLVDPLSGNVRYIGQSVNPTYRLRYHLRIKKPSTHKEFWINSLLRLGLVPEMIILETTTKKNSCELEIYWIAWYRNNGFILTNSTDGGDVPPHSKETHKKISIAKIGSKASATARLNMSLARIGKKHSLVAKEKMSAAKKGKRLTAQHAANIAIAKTGHKTTLETRAKISAAKIGKEFFAETKARMSSAQKLRFAR